MTITDERNGKEEPIEGETMREVAKRARFDREGDFTVQDRIGLVQAE